MPEHLSNIELLTLTWSKAEQALNLSVSKTLILIVIGIMAFIAIWYWLMGGFALRNFEIDQAEIGIGDTKLSLRPNLTDRQVAYAIWVELSTRKIGLKIDFEHDVIAEVYDSWHDFFTITRELIKSIPVSQTKRDSTQKIIRLSVEVLNQGLRPHLTRWQARFRHWYDRELKKYDNATGQDVLDPQKIQEQFPNYAELKKDMEKINTKLMSYRAQMGTLIITIKTKKAPFLDWVKRHFKKAQSQ